MTQARLRHSTGNVVGRPSPTAIHCKCGWPPTASADGRPSPTTTPASRYQPGGPPITHHHSPPLAAPLARPLRLHRHPPPLDRKRGGPPIPNCRPSPTATHCECGWPLVMRGHPLPLESSADGRLSPTTPLCLSLRRWWAARHHPLQPWWPTTMGCLSL